MGDLFKNKEYKEAIFLYFKISTWIIFPIILALIVGKYFDKRFNTSPWIFIVFVGFAFLLTCIGILKEVKKYQNKIEKEILENKKNKDGKSDDTK